MTRTTKRPKVMVMVIAHDEGDRMERLAICAQYFQNAPLNFWFAVAYDTDRVADEVRAHCHILHHVSNKQPLGARHNEMLSLLMREEWDYLMQLGSDDVITPTGYATALSWMRQGCEFGAFVKLGIVNKSRTRYKFHQGMGNMGAGRFISRRVVEKVLSERNLWPPYLQKGLDGNSEIAVAEVAKLQVSPVNTYRPCVFDFKGDSNLHSYEKFGGKEQEFTMDMLSI